MLDLVLRANIYFWCSNRDEGNYLAGLSAVPSGPRSSMSCSKLISKLYKEASPTSDEGLRFFPVTPEGVYGSSCCELVRAITIRMRVAFANVVLTGRLSGCQKWEPSPMRGDHNQLLCCQASLFGFFGASASVDWGHMLTFHCPLVTDVSSVGTFGDVRCSQVSCQELIVISCT